MSALYKQITGFKQFDIKLNNVFDTMIGDVVFLTQYAFGGFLPAFNRSLSTVLRDYLGIEDFCVRICHHLNVNLFLWNVYTTFIYLFNVVYSHVISDARF